MISRARVVALAILAVIATGFSAVLLPPWNAGANAVPVVDLGALPGFDSSYSGAINNSGDVVGTSSAGGPSHAFLYSRGTLLDLDFSSDTYSYANGINDTDQIVGQFNPGGGGSRTLISQSGITSELPQAQGTQSVGYATCLSVQGQQAQRSGYSSRRNPEWSAGDQCKGRRCWLVPHGLRILARISIHERVDG